MLSFTAALQKFGQKSEETGRASLGWTYIDIPADVTEQLQPGRRTSFRVQGRLDQYVFQQVALMPTGDGTFILLVNAAMRRALRKEAGATVTVTLDVDDVPPALSADLLACLDDEPRARAFFDTLPPGHQRYFSRWIDEAKTPDTKAKRLTQAVNGLALGLGYGDMIRYYKNRR